MSLFLKSEMNEKKSVGNNPEKKSANASPLVIIENYLLKYQNFQLVPFAMYLSEVWKDLSLRSKNRAKGINRVTFSHYFKLPGLLGIRLFNIFDKNKDDFLSPKEFVEGMLLLFTEDVKTLIDFIFLFYDFNQDDIITKDDIKVALSYIPLLEDFNEMITLQDELYNIVEKSFGTKTQMNKEEYFNCVIKEESYGLFVPMLVFLYENKPFCAEEISEIYEPYINEIDNASNDSFEGANHYEIKGCITLEEREKDASDNPNPEQKHFHKVSSCRVLHNERQADNIFGLEHHSSKGEKRKRRGTFAAPKISDAQTNALLITPGFQKLKNVVPTLLKSSNLLPQVPVKSDKMNSDNTSNSNSDEYEGIKFLPSTKTSKGNYVLVESSLLKCTPNSKRMKKMYFKLIGSNLYYFKSINSKKHEGMHNLTGFFLEYDLSQEVMFNDSNYFYFSLISPSKKTHKYFSDDYRTSIKWVSTLSKLLGCQKIKDLYDIGELLGQGKFSKVRIGIDRTTKKKYAIKRIKKDSLLTNDLDLIKVEIDILKICQHPYIIKLYNVIETISSINIVLEYCPGGNLFTYFERRKFYFPEEKVVEFIHKISTAVFCMHSLGIIHRDLKLSNIVMTDSSDNADIRILDFGLSKILGPGEKCTESYGTIGYAAPEVIKETPYDFKADIWSLGVIAYFLFSGRLPFEEKLAKNTKKEIIYKTLHEEPKFDGECWKSISKEGISFIKDLMKKDPAKRLGIKEVLEHSWFKNYYGELVEKRRNSRYDIQNGNGEMYKIYATIKLEK